MGDDFSTWMMYTSLFFDDKKPPETKEFVQCVTQTCLLHQQAMYFTIFACFIPLSIAIWCWINWRGIQEWRSHMKEFEDE